ncbi:MAG TPA: helix-turn-helix domain-containing protein [Solirubrobacteraceae bacterium]
MSSQPDPSRPGPRPRFTREQVLAAALRVIDREQPDAFTMRRVADELGVGVMTLYGYVRNKDEILEGVTALAIAAEPEPAAGASWDERLRGDAELLYALCRRHPNLVRLVMRQASGAPGLGQVRERMREALEGAGFGELAAQHALGALTSYAIGFGALAFRHGSADVPAHLSDAAFAYGLDLVLGGLRAELG